MDLVVSGHTHAYLRGKNNGVNYMVVGGAGGDIDLEKAYDWGDIFQVKELVYHAGVLNIFHNNTIVWIAKDLTNNLIDYFEIHKNP